MPRPWRVGFAAEQVGSSWRLDDLPYGVLNQAAVQKFFDSVRDIVENQLA